MMSIDGFLGKTYHPAYYNCAHLAIDVWRAETGQDITPHLTGFLSGAQSRGVYRDALKVFKRLSKPVSPCLALMNPAGYRTPHVGVFIRGKVLHITADHGVLYQPLELATIGYSVVRFYTC